jgi:hypothetical protein
MSPKLLLPLPRPGAARRAAATADIVGAGGKAPGPLLVEAPTAS